MLNLGPQCANLVGIAPDRVKNHALEIRSLGNVHGRTGSVLRLCTRRITTRFKEFVQHIVFVGGYDQLFDRQAHAARNMPGTNITEIAGGNGKRNWIADIFYHRQVRLEVIHDLR